MQKVIKNYVLTAHTHLRLGYEVFCITKRELKKILKELNGVTNYNENILSKPLVKRIHLYITIGVITKRLFCTLRGFKATKIESQNILYLSVIIPLIDDLTDTLKIDSVDIEKELQNNEASLHSTIPLIKYLYSILIENCSSDFVQLFYQAAKAQDDSISQLKDIRLEKSVLTKITAEKGGLALLLFRSIFDNKLKLGEQKAIYKLGNILQLLNDMFDVYKDFNNKQQTLYTNTNDLNENKKDFNYFVNELTSEFLSLDYKFKNIRKCLCEISIFTSRGMVCLEQLLDCQLKSGGKFNIGYYNRIQLICDMEKPSNIFKAFRYSVEYCKQIQ